MAEIGRQDNIIVEQKASIKLVKNTKGYGWEIKAVGNTMEEILADIESTNDVLKTRYGNEVK